MPFKSPSHTLNHPATSRGQFFLPQFSPGLSLGSSIIVDMCELYPSNVKRQSENRGLLDSRILDHIYS